MWLIGRMNFQFLMLLSFLKLQIGRLLKWMIQVDKLILGSFHFDKVEMILRSDKLGQFVLSGKWFFEL